MGEARVRGERRRAARAHHRLPALAAGLLSGLRSVGGGWGLLPARSAGESERSEPVWVSTFRDRRSAASTGAQPHQRHRGPRMAATVLAITTAGLRTATRNTTVSSELLSAVAKIPTAS
jgi:hypothetical protein